MVHCVYVGKPSDTGQPTRPTQPFILPGPVYRMCAQVAPSGVCLRGEGPPDRMLAKPSHRLFAAAYTLWAKPGCYCCPA